VCHSDLADQAGLDVSIDAHWCSTMMANSAKDPLWQAKVSSEVARNPALKEVIESECAKCHMPMAYAQAVADGSPVAILDDGFLDRDHPRHKAAMDGVSCTVCHQIQDSDLGKPAGFSGHYQIDPSTAPPNRLIFGPFADPFWRPMRNMVGFRPVHAEHISESGLCATCHTLFTPTVDAEGNVQGEFPEQSPYLEWENSMYAEGASDEKTCQQCHMPEAEGAVVISNRPMRRLLAPRSPFSQHHFVGANTYMLNVLRSHVRELRLTASTALLEDTWDRTLNQLQNETADLSIANAQIREGVLTLILHIENKAGHKLPTSFPSRRAWLHLAVADGTGQIVFESGEPQPDGSIAGNDADAAPAAYEPHHQVISSPDQVQIYEPIMQNSDDQVTYTLLRAASYVKDNRLLPRGFDKGGAGEAIAVRGEAASDEDFADGSDTVTYQIDVQGYSGPFTLSAAFLYQTLSYRFAQDLAQEDTPLIEKFMQQYRESDKRPAILATVQETIR
jgi:hypothetical protein